MRIGLALSIHNGGDIREQVGQAFFAALAASRGEGIDADDPSLQLVHPLTDRPAIPAQLPFSQPLTSFTQGLNRPGHKQAAGTAFERLSCLHQQVFDCLCQFHCHPSMITAFGTVYHIWDDLLLESPLSQTTGWSLMVSFPSSSRFPT